jgi:hypothetical protein
VAEQKRFLYFFIAKSKTGKAAQPLVGDGLGNEAQFVRGILMSANSHHEDGHAMLAIIGQDFKRSAVTCGEYLR